MDCSIQRQLSVAIENQPGRLAAVCRALAARNINVRNLTVVDNIEQGMIRLIPSDLALCRSILADVGLYVVEAEVLVIILKDIPGQLAHIAEALGQHQINIDYIYGTEDSTESEMRLVLKVSQLAKARDVILALPDHG